MASITTYALFYTVGWLIQSDGNTSVYSSPIAVSFMRTKPEANSNPTKTSRTLPEIPSLKLPLDLVGFQTRAPQARFAEPLSINTPPTLDIRTELLGFARADFAPSLRQAESAVIKPPTDFMPSFRVEPIYPAFARSRGIEGWVKIAFTLDRRAQVVAPHILASQPPGVFDYSALNAVSQWRYPLELKRQHDDNPLHVVIKFRLEK